MHAARSMTGRGRDHGALTVVGPVLLCDRWPGQEVISVSEVSIKQTLWCRATAPRLCAWCLDEIRSDDAPRLSQGIEFLMFRTRQMQSRHSVRRPIFQEGFDRSRATHRKCLSDN